MGAGGTIVDLFCGCGGFSLGAELAGFRSLAAIDVDATLQSGYRRNFPQARSVEASVADLGGPEWRRILGRARPDGVIGGPPCQGFSWIGKKFEGDPRNTLIAEFFRQVAILRPKFFVMENVEGLLHDGNIRYLEEGIASLPGEYVVNAPVVVNAAELGAATTRQRVVVLGWNPSEIEALDAGEILSSRGEVATVRDAISDLPSPCHVGQNREDFSWARYPHRAKSSLSRYASAMRTLPPPGVGDAEAITRMSEGYVSGLDRTIHRADISQRYASIIPGKSDPITKSYKLAWEGRCPTLRAGTGADKGAFQAVRPLHPSLGRVITVREAARLQGFPDWFLFHPTKWHSFRMIGNSVSPIVSRSIFDHVLRKLRGPLAA